MSRIQIGCSCYGKPIEGRSSRSNLPSHFDSIDLDMLEQLNNIIEEMYDPTKCKCTVGLESVPVMCACRLSELAYKIYKFPRVRGIMPPGINICCNNCYKAVEAACLILYGPTTIQDIADQLAILTKEIKLLRTENEILKSLIKKSENTY